MRPRHALAIVALTTTLVSCSTPSPQATAPPLETRPLRLYATTATASLANDLALAYSESRPDLRFTLRSNNYQSLIEQLLNDDDAYFLSSHLPPDRPLWAAPIGQDGIAVIAHRESGIRDLSLDELRAIYQGRVTGWHEFGGSRLPITVFSRESGSGTRAEFERQVMGQRPTTGAARIAASSEAMLATIAATPGSIGYVSLGVANRHTRFDDASLALVALDGVEATQNAVADHTYPLRMTLYVVGQIEPDDLYRAFFAWMQSPEGQAVISRHYAPVN